MAGFSMVPIAYNCLYFFCCSKDLYSKVGTILLVVSFNNNHHIIACEELRFGCFYVIHRGFDLNAFLTHEAIFYTYQLFVCTINLGEGIELSCFLLLTSTSDMKFMKSTVSACSFLCRLFEYSKYSEIEP